MPNARITAGPVFHGDDPRRAGGGPRAGDGHRRRRRIPLPVMLVPLALLSPTGCVRLGRSDQIMFAVGAALPAEPEAEGVGWYVLLGDLYGDPAEGASYPAGWRIDFASVPVADATVNSVQACYVVGWRPRRARWLALVGQAGFALHFSESETGVGPAVGGGIELYLAEWGESNSLTVSARYVKAPIVIEDDFPSWTVDAYLLGLSLTLLVD